MLGALASLLAQTPQEPDPAVVTPGLLGLGVTIVLAVTLYFLFRSMTRHLKQVDFPEDATSAEQTGPAAPAGNDEQQQSRQ